MAISTIIGYMLFGAVIDGVVNHRYDHDGENIIQYLCCSTSKLTRSSSERLDIILNISFQDESVYQQLLFEKKNRNQMALHFAVTANQYNIVPFVIEDGKWRVNGKLDLNAVDENDQTIMHIAIERILLKCCSTCCSVRVWISPKRIG